MNRHRIERHSSRTAIAICIVCATVVSLTFHGCARSPREFLSGLGGERSEKAKMVPPCESSPTPAASTQSIAQAEDPWADPQSDSSIRQVGYQADSCLPVAEPSVKPEENRLQTILQQRRQEQDSRFNPTNRFRPMTASRRSNSIRSEASPQLPHQPKPQRQSPNASDESTVRFANGFEARMAEIRRELNERDQSTIETASTVSETSDMPVWAQPRTSPPVGNAPSNLSQAIPEVTANEELFGNPVIVPADKSNHVAAETVNDETATVPHDQPTGESEDWAIEPASAEAPADASGSDSRLANWLHRHDESSPPSNSSPAFVEQTVAYSAEPLVSSGGVKLLAPIVDDRSFDSSEGIYGRPDRSEEHRATTAETIASIERPERVDFADLLKTWNESEPEQSLPTESRAETLRPLPPLSTIDRAELASPDPAMASDSANWPQFTSPRDDAADREPIRVAVAPPLSAAPVTSLAAHPTGPESGRLSPTHASSTGREKSWLRQALWLAGGVTLLFVAIRLTTRRSEEA